MKNFVVCLIIFKVHLFETIYDFDKKLSKISPYSSPVPFKVSLDYKVLKCSTCSFNKASVRLQREKCRAYERILCEAFIVESS